MATRTDLFSRVFVVQGPTDPLPDVARFGHPVALAGGEAGPMFDPQRSYNMVAKGLADFNDRDFLLPVGDPILSGLALVVAAGINSGRVRVLRWTPSAFPGRENDGYIVVTVDLNQGAVHFEDDVSVAHVG